MDQPSLTTKHPWQSIEPTHPAGPLDLEDLDDVIGGGLSLVNCHNSSGSSSCCNCIGNTACC